MYFTNDQIGLPNDYYMYWSAPENGKYYFTLDYNHSDQSHISYYIVKAWSTEETLHVRIYLPLLAEYAAPTFTFGAVLLAVGAAILMRKPKQTEEVTLG